MDLGLIYRLLSEEGNLGLLPAYSQLPLLKNLNDQEHDTVNGIFLDLLEPLKQLPMLAYQDSNSALI